MKCFNCDKPIEEFGPEGRCVHGAVLFEGSPGLGSCFDSTLLSEESLQIAVCDSCMKIKFSSINLVYQERPIVQIAEVRRWSPVSGLRLPGACCIETRREIEGRSDTSGPPRLQGTIMRRATIAVLWCLTACFQEDELPADDSTGSSSSSLFTSSSTSTTVDPSSSSEASSSTGTDPDGGSSSSDDTISPDTSSSSTAEPVTDWALYFDGASAMQSTDAIDLVLGNDFTIEAWVRIDSADAHGTLVAYRGIGTSGWSLVLESMQSRFVFGFFDNNGEWHEVIGTDAGDLDPGWHHVAGTKHGTSLFMHVDGTVAATNPCAATASAPTVPLAIGAYSDEEADALIYVAIDDIRISDVARYQSEFTPDEDFDADPSTRVLVVSDEGEGSATFDASASITFDLEGVTWTPGNTAS